GAYATGTTETGYVENATSNAVYATAQNTPVLDYSLEPVTIISNAIDTFWLNVTNIGTDGVFYDAGNDVIEIIIPATWGDPTAVTYPLNWDYQWLNATRTLRFYHNGGFDYNWPYGTTLAFNYDIQAPLSQGKFDFDITGSIHDSGASQYYLNRTLYVDVILGPLDHIEVTPNPINVTVGDIQTFTAVAYDFYNNVIPGVDFVWTTDVGSIDSSGLLTAQTSPGTGTVTAANGTVSGSAVVNVVAGAFDHIVVTPDPTTVAVGQTRLFAATAYDVYDNPLSGIGFDWSTDVGAVDAAGLFTAQTIPAVGQVTARNGTVSGSATVNVVPGAVEYIIVTPNPVILTVGDTQAFTAVAYDVYNNVIPTAVITWSTSVGLINSTGFFTAQTTPGFGTVNATNGSVSGLAVVSVVVGTLDHIIVTPDPANVIAGQVQIFTATGYDVYSNVIPGLVFTWDTDVGTVDPSGLFIAQITPGTGVVNATNGSMTGSAVVNVIAGQLDHITVTPDPANLVVGTTQQFVATAYDVFNNVIPGVEFIWATDVGSINTTGFFTAPTVSTSGQVVATNGTFSGT
ncbi:MAG: hypothetical protein KAX31_05705, partial [Thermoplasmata archaeon]|nr:hypothetical protein [Thermoplasmata archaeon]